MKQLTKQELHFVHWPVENLPNELF